MNVLVLEMHSSGGIIAADNAREWKVRRHHKTGDHAIVPSTRAGDSQIGENTTMKTLALYKGILTAVASSLTITLLTKSWAGLASIQLEPDTLLLCAVAALLASVVVIFIWRTDRSIKLRLDLLFRMGYQAPFVRDIRDDEEERALYSASILRKLKDLAELNRAFRDEHLCSYYIGCLAFLANEKRANLPWNTFRDELAKHFAKEIIEGKIARHVIDDHYKGKWSDLLRTAELTKARRNPRLAAISKLRRNEK